eukprot:TRINITY_DN59868_c0_g1_i1.p1 TRINITY_DN59868_c0_g1~~TRINITY_DN59868_c0_g1_i1.p1  ORF type:complete len:177 (-),score=30.37 TRINITY_DN59868_c0_g1_i1:256-756(-)
MSLPGQLIQGNGDAEGQQPTIIGNGPTSQNSLYQIQTGFTTTVQAPAPAAVVQAAPPPQQQTPPLSDLMVQLEDYTPTIPDSVTAHYLTSAGFDTSDSRLLRLVSLAAQKFVSDVANDALTHCKMRQANIPSKKSSKDRKYVMTNEDLASALGEQGISARKPPYYQ